MSASSSFDPTGAFGERVRHHFVLDPDVVFLNHASFGATPRSVLAARRALEDELEAQPVAFFERLPPRIRAMVAQVAPVLGAPADCLLPVDNATTGVTAVLRSLPLGPGDAILTTNLAYAAVSKGIRFVAERRGCDIVEAEVPYPLDGPEQVVDAVMDAVTERVRIAVIDHITSVTGLVFPVEELIERLHARGVPVLVDGAHVPGHLDVDLEALGADYWVGNLHKWLFAVKGCAVLYAHPRTHDTLAPLVISHGWGESLPAAFDYQGTRDPTGWLSVPAALSFAEEVGGLPAIREHNRRLAHHGARIVADAVGLSPGAPLSMCPALVSLVVPGPTGFERSTTVVRRLLEEHRVQTFAMPVPQGIVVRVCAQIYNTEADYEQLARGLAAVR